MSHSPEVVLSRTESLRTDLSRCNDLTTHVQKPDTQDQRLFSGGFPKLELTVGENFHAGLKT
jgi:hypothetical protein